MRWFQLSATLYWRLWLEVFVPIFEQTVFLDECFLDASVQILSSSSLVMSEMKPIPSE
jgi:hypothetical protein